MRTYPASEARASLPAILDFVAEGEEITITRHGRPVAVVLHPDALRTRRATEAVRRAGELLADLELAKGEARPIVGLTEERAEELVAWVRAGRAER